MDAKTGYSTMVTGSKSAATTNEELNKKITAGQSRKAIYGANWTSVNINTIVDRFTPGAAPDLVNGKVKSQLYGQQWQTARSKQS